MDANNVAINTSAEQTAAVEPQGQGNKRPKLPGNSSSYRLRSREDIYTYLQKLQKSHTLLSVKIGESALDFGTVILQINKEKSFLILDELYPRNNISAAVLNQVLSIDTLLDGIQLQFATKVDHVAKKDGTEYYRVGIPKLVHYYQRREYFRVSISLSTPLLASLTTENDVKLTAELKDLSQGGLSARVETGTEKLSAEDKLPKCVIKTSDGHKISCGLEIVRVNDSNSKQHKLIAGKFTGLDNKNKNELSKVIAKLQRENIKALKRHSGD